MKILITTDLYGGTVNGVVTSIRNLRDVLERKGHELRILTMSNKPYSYTEGGVYYIRSIPLDVIYPHVRMPIPFHHRLVQELIDWRPDVIHSQCEFFSFQYARRIARATGAPIVHTYHTLYEQYCGYLFPSQRLGEQLVRTVSRLRLRPVDRLVAPTYKVRDALEGYGLRNTISVVPSGIDLAQHRQRLDPEERAARRRALGIRDDQLVLLNLGRLGTEKNLDEILRYFARDAAEDMVFLIVGDGPARTSLTQLAADLGVADRVIFTGMIAPEEVQQYYQLGDIFVSASTSETQGLTYVEASANGLPLLCRQDRCLTDVLLQGDNGYAYANEAEFRRYLRAIATDPVWRANAARRSEEISAGFDKQSFGNAIEAIYQSVV